MALPTLLHATSLPPSAATGAQATSDAYAWTSTPAPYQPMPLDGFGGTNASPVPEATDASAYGLPGPPPDSPEARWVQEVIRTGQLPPDFVIDELRDRAGQYQKMQSLASQLPWSPKPSKEHQVLARLAADWEGEVQLHASPRCASSATSTGRS